MHLNLAIEKHRQILRESCDHASLIKAVKVDAAWSEYHVVHVLLAYFAKLYLDLFRKSLDWWVLKMARCADSTYQDILYAQCIAR